MVAAPTNLLSNAPALPRQFAPTPAKPMAVTCRGVARSFGFGENRVPVLRGVDLEVPAGDVTLLMGPSGCGKTTLISVLAGLLTADSGQVEVLGTNLSQLRGGKLVDFRAQNLGFVFQQFNLLTALTAVENAAVPLMVLGRSAWRAKQVARDLLVKLGLEKHLEKYPNQLSGGQQQRVAIARALVHNPKLVICDEPTAALDAAAGQTVMNLLCELAVDGQRSVIVVTHDHRIESFAHRILTMADGKIEKIEEKSARPFAAAGEGV